MRRRVLARAGGGARLLVLSGAAARYRGGMEPPRRLDDDVLAEEIELYGDLVVAASESDDVLPQEEIDRLLGLRRD